MNDEYSEYSDIHEQIEECQFQINDARKKILELIGKLPRNEWQECDCGTNDGTIEIEEQGIYCLHCGGLVSNRRMNGGF